MSAVVLQPGAADPHPAYAALRQAGPIHWSEDFFGGAWVLTRHADAEQVLRDPRFSAARTGGWVRRGETQRREAGAFQRLFARALLFLDGQDHAGLRRLMMAGFDGQAMAALRPWIEQRCTALMDTLQAEQAAAPERPVDWIAGVARRLPAGVISRLLGLPAEDEPMLVGWSDEIAPFLGAADPSPEVTRRAERALVAMAGYFRSHFDRSPGAAAQEPAGLLDRLLLAHRQGQAGLDDSVGLLAQATMLLFAGHETTRHLLGNAVQLLLAHPAQWQALRADPGLAPAAVREALRHQCPVQYSGRRVVTPLELHGQRLERGDGVIVLIGAANRDPERFERPDDFDIALPRRASLAFGSGPHVCIGAALTRLEGEIMLGQLARRWPHLALAQPETPDWVPDQPLYRGLRSLPLWLQGPPA